MMLIDENLCNWDIDNGNSINVICPTIRVIIYESKSDNGKDLFTVITRSLAHSLQAVWAVSLQYLCLYLLPLTMFLSGSLQGVLEIVFAYSI